MPLRIADCEVIKFDPIPSKCDQSPAVKIEFKTVLLFST
jgi:hypothetical protein